MAKLPPLIQRRLDELPGGLREHIERSRQVALDLARRHGADGVRADLGIAAHDLARAIKADALLDEARRLELAVHPVQARNPILLHGPIAAAWLEQEDGIGDQEVLEAVRWHTTGLRSMGTLAKVVFLADKLDPRKVERFPYLEQIRLLAQESLDRAIVKLLDHELAYFLRESCLIHPESVELRNELLMTLTDESG